MKNFKYDTIMVHGGTFNADDVMCVAICKVIKPWIRVERVLEVPEDVPETTLVADIGLGKFDHHQEDVKLREDGHKRAACGLLFEEFGDILFVDEDIKSEFERNIIYAIEDTDNGINENPLSSAITRFNPVLNDEEDVYDGFGDAVQLCVGIIRKYRLHSEANKSAKNKVDITLKINSKVKDILTRYAIKTVNSKGLVILSHYVPFNLFLDTGVKLIICPSDKGEYNINTVKVSKDSFEDKVPLPESWLENPPEGCTFVHKNRSIASFRTVEEAIIAANSILYA